MAKNWIKGAIKHPGALKKTAKAHDMTVAQFIANPPKNISSTTKKRVQLAKTLRGFNK